MGTKHVRSLLLIIIAVLTATVWTSHADAARPKRHRLLETLRGYSTIVLDASTGAVLSEDNADAERYPASLTKMMTLYLVFDALHSGKLTLDTKLTASAHAAEQSPTKLGLRPGEQVAVRDVVLGMVTRSANDAAVVAAEALGGTEEHFAQMMTARAHQLGMNSTNFHNASGLPDPLQTTTARDIARLSRALIRDYPQYYTYFSTPEFTFAGQRITNHNHLMSWYEGADGIKTGFINAAGFNLAASAVRDGRRLIGVVLGGPSPYARDRYMAKLLDAGFAGTAPVSSDIREASVVTPMPAPAPQLTKPTATARAAKLAQAQAKKTKRRSVGVDTAVAATPASFTRPARDGDHGWAIQVGAFGRIDGARKAAESAAELAPMQLTEAGIEISSLKSHKHSAVHRARLLGLTEAQAHDACQILVHKDKDCLVLSPSDLRGRSTRIAIN
jgi:D-alanyl-D-alanine carboxypeptidase